MATTQVAEPRSTTGRAERRQNDRIACRVIVEKVGPSSDISAGGIRVLTANPCSEGAEIRLAFELPESEQSVQCHGRVVRVAPSTIDGELFEMGIQFQRMMARHRDALRDYVDGRYAEDLDEE